jgi:glycosyltransferase involved in cell wall biosynthesis
MKVGVNALFLIPGEVGGSETYLVETLRALAATQPDLELVVFTNLECDAFLCERLDEFPNVSFQLVPVRARNRAARILTEQLKLPGLVREAGVQVLWSPGYTAPLRAPCPQVVSILDMQYLSHPADLTWPAWLATHTLVMQAAERCDHVLTLSEFAKREIIREAGVAPEKVTPTLLAAAPDFFEPVGPEALAALRREVLGFAEPFILCVAHTYPHKNVHRLVEAFAQLGDLQHRLVLVGRPRRGEREVQAALARLPNAMRVKRLERATRSDLVALYQAADVFAFPSLYEGFGLPVLEAMAAGTPVLAMRQASLPEVGGEAIAYCEQDDAAELAGRIREILAFSAEERKVRLASARVRAAAFSWAATAATVAGVLRAVGARR